MDLYKFRRKFLSCYHMYALFLKKKISLIFTILKLSGFVEKAQTFKEKLFSFR